MLYRICGRSGSGKTEYMLSLLGDIMSSGGNAVVIVPEQQSLEYEKQVFTRFGSDANLKCEILNFERLPNRTYREFGGLSGLHIDKSARELLVATAVSNVSSKLAAYKNVADDIDFVKTVSAQITQMKQNGITPKLLLDIDGVPKSLAQKTSDIALICEEYDRLIKGVGTDTADLLTSYAENLSEMPFFEGKTVIIDSFYSFTWQQHKIIDVIASQATDVYVSLVFDFDDKTGVFDEVRESYLRLSRYNSVKDVVLPKTMRFLSKSLEFAEENLWSNSKANCDTADGVEFIECRTSFDECEAAASKITSLLRNGVRMRDIAVIYRGGDVYDGVVDAVLQKHGINAFLSKKDELSEKPLAVSIVSAIQACCDGFSLPSVKKYIKCGYTSLAPKSARLLLRYADTWDIRGSAWISDGAWVNNPDGYIEIPTQRQKRELLEVNKAKEEVALQLSALYATFSKNELTVSEGASAVYTHLVSVGADKTVSKKALEYRTNGDEDGAQKTVQLWDMVVSVLDVMHKYIGNVTVSPRRFLFLFSLALSEHKVGTIPLYADAVTVGDASMIRAGNVSDVILLGVNDGVFPSSVSRIGLLQEDELVILEQKGIVLGDTYKKQLAKEKFLFYVSCASAKNSLTVIYNNTRPSRASFGALRLMSMFRGAKKHIFGNEFYDISFSPAAASQNITRMPENIKEMLTERGLNMELRAKQIPLCDPNAQISGGTQGMFLSPSRLEKYTYCSFSYFGRYVLKLSQNKKAAFDYPEIGTFVHKILEIFVSSKVKDGVFVKPSDSEIKSSVDSMTNEYILSVCRGKGDKRFKYICTRLKNTLFLLLKNICDELSESKFVPIYFEHKLSGDETVITSKNGVKVNVCGTVDRVDEFKKGRKTYIRVVDYKTGATVFSKKALKEGLGLQMFLYMFAICQKEQKLPAGVLYLPSSLAVGRVASPEEAGDTDGFVKKRFRRNGLLLDDFDIVDAMEKGANGVYLPAKLKKDGTFDANSSLASAEEFGKLKLSVESYLGKLADKIASGDMCVSPLKLDPSHSACSFCDMRTVCRMASDNSVAREHNEFQIEMGDSNA